MTMKLVYVHPSEMHAYLAMIGAYFVFYSALITSFFTPTHYVTRHMEIWHFNLILP